MKSVAASNYPKILIVNDDAGSLLALTTLLSNWSEQNDCEIVTARSGQEALRHVLHHDFAVILLDINMPGMDGFETAEAIHSRGRSASVPIIFVTAFLSDDIERLKAYQKGAVDYLLTPIIPQILQAKVAVFVELSKNSIALNQHAETLSQRTAELLATNKQLKAEISQRKAAVKQNKAKDEFLAMLGHELRNPLSAISSAVSLIRMPRVTEQVAERAKVILARQTQHLSRIVDDLLDLGRVMSGKISLSAQPVEFSKVLEGCIETLTASGRTQGYKMSVRSERAWVSGDPARIEQIITNILDNALKYTPAGGTIDIDLGVEAGFVKLTVRDSGIGISSDLLSRVFEVFVQGEISLDRGKGGLGIGLALVKQLVELHDGTISALSKGDGHGSTFEICLPYWHMTEALSAPAPEALPKAMYRILLIEDNHDARELLSSMLLNQGHTIFQAADGTDGLQIASANKPEVILIDIGLPGIDGYQVAKNLRANPETAEARLIALTGYGLEEDRERALAAGFDVHLVKPVQLHNLNAAIYAFPPLPLSSAY